MKITIENVLDANPCFKYSRSRVVELFNGREMLTAEDVVALTIPTSDAIWALLKLFMTDDQRRLFAVFCAKEAVCLRLHSGSEYNRLAKLFARGEISDAALTEIREQAHLCIPNSHLQSSVINTVKWATDMNCGWMSGYYAMESAFIAAYYAGVNSQRFQDRIVIYALDLINGRKP